MSEWVLGLFYLYCMVAEQVRVPAVYLALKLFQKKKRSVQGRREDVRPLRSHAQSGAVRGTEVEVGCL